MPQKKAAKKELRKGVARSAKNATAKRNIKEILKVAAKAVAAGDATKATEAYMKLQVAVDKAVKTGVLKANNASRKKSRLSNKIQSLGKKK